MIWLKLAVWEARNALRELVPRRWLRRSLAGAFALAELAFCGLALIVPLPERRALDLGTLSGLFAMNLMLSSALAALALSRLVAAPRQLELSRLSPLGAARGVWLALAPALIAGSLPLTALLLPFALVVARQAPVTALGMALTAFAILAWGLLIAVAAVNEVVARWGRARAAALLRSWGALLPLALVLAFKPLVRVQAPAAAPLGFLLASPLLLPLIWPRVAGRFLRALGAQEQLAGSAREPRWGSPGWARELWRTLALRTLLAPVTLLLIAAWRPGAWPALLSLSLIFIVMVPLGQLLAPEWRAPDRLRLAPYAARYRLRLVSATGGGALAIALLMALLLGWSRWRWLAAEGLAAALAVPICLLPQRTLRGIGQLLISLVAVAAIAFWN
jgi:hypothetical protein